MFIARPSSLIYVISLKSDSIPACVAICPITVNSHFLDCLHERQQPPLKLAWVMTIHKSQGVNPAKGMDQYW